MSHMERVRRFVLGSALDPLDERTRHRIALIPLLAWIGLGADGLSSSCYGPEQAFRALGSHMHLGLYLAVATSLAVFIIAAGYNQVIELFPTGGGGYRVATALLGPRAGLVSGCALLVDYVLTITTSLAQRSRCVLQFIASRGTGIQAGYGIYPDPGDDHAELSRDEGIGRGAGADLSGFCGHALPADRLWGRRAWGASTLAHPGHARRDPWSGA